MNGSAAPVHAQELHRQVPEERRELLQPLVYPRGDLSAAVLVSGKAAIPWLQQYGSRRPEGPQPHVQLREQSVGAQGLFVDDEDHATAVEGPVLYRPGHGVLECFKDDFVADDEGALVDVPEQRWAEAEKPRTPHILNRTLFEQCKEKKTARFIHLYTSEVSGYV